jgi:hypothetical protein
LSLTILSAQYANRDHTAAVIVTAERGAVAISESARPQLWAAMQEWRIIPGNGVAAFPLDDLKADLLARIAARYDAALEVGMAYQGKTLQIRPQDQANLTTMGNEARWAKAVGAAWPADFAWRMKDDTFLSLSTADAMIALGEAAKAEVYRLRRVKWAHDDAVKALATADQIDAYNIETGW